jgi:hypothetical protein
MSHAINTHDTDGVRDLVEHAVVSDANAPVVLTALELPAAGRARIYGQCLNRVDHPVMHLGGQSPQITLGRPFELDLVPGSVPAAVCQVFLQGAIVARLVAGAF